MIYLIQSPSYADETRKTYKDILKIGYTADDLAEKRFYMYKNHNPSRVVLFTILAGTLQDESNLHAYFSKYRITEMGREWYEYSDEIIEFFKTHTTVESLAVLPPYQSKRSAEAQARKEEREKLFGSLSDKEKATYDELIEMSVYNRLKYICEKIGSGDNELLPFLRKIPLFSAYAEYVDEIGTDGIRRFGYNVTRISGEIERLKFDWCALDSLVYSKFSVGDRLQFGEIKSRLKDIYEECGYKKAAKSTDIEDWFEVRTTFLTLTLKDGTKKRAQGYELLSKKSRDVK